MEGKAVLFKEFGGVDAWPLCLATKDVDEIVAHRRRRSRRSSAGSTSRTSRRRAASRSSAGCATTLDIPVFHDDQHGTAIVVLAAFLNALKVVGKAPRTCASSHRRRRRRDGGDADAARRGRRDIVGCDRARRALSRPAPGSTPSKAAYAELTNPRDLRGTADEALDGRRRLHRPLRPGRRQRRRRPANGRPGDRLRDGEPDTRGRCRRRSRTPSTVIATGRSDYPNQINNVLAFPGVFRGALDVRASGSPSEMELAAARAIAAVVKPERALGRLHRPERLQPRRRAARRGGRRELGRGVRRRPPRRPAGEPDLSELPLA